MLSIHLTSTLQLQFCGTVAQNRVLHTSYRLPLLSIRRPAIIDQPCQLASALCRQRSRLRSSLSRIQQKSWAGLLKKGDEDAYVALLLSSLPIVKSLDLRIPGDGFKELDRTAIKGGNSLPDPTSLSFAESGGH